MPQHAHGGELIPASEQQRKASVLLESMEPHFGKALSTIDPARFARVCLTEVRKNPKLAECSDQSLLGAFMQAAQLDLEPGVQGQCWVLPYFNSKTKQREAQLIPGYQGLCDLAYRSGLVASINADVVYEGDVFEYERGTQDRISHIPRYETRDPDKITHAWCVVRTSNGGVILDVIPRVEIDKIRVRAKKGDFSPWSTDYPMMCRKTIVKRCLKLAPASIKLRRAISLDDLAEVGKPQDLAEVVQVPDDEPAVADEVTICYECRGEFLTRDYPLGCPHCADARAAAAAQADSDAWDEEEASSEGDPLPPGESSELPPLEQDQPCPHCQRSWRLYSDAKIGHGTTQKDEPCPYRVAGS